MRRETNKQLSAATPGYSEHDGSTRGYAITRRPHFAQLSRQQLLRIKAVAGNEQYTGGTTLFSEESSSRGIFILFEGRAKLYVCSSSGRSLVLGFFGNGTILGLESILLNCPYMATAEIIEPSRGVFIEHDDLLKCLGGDEKGALVAAKMVSETCHFLLHRIKSIELSESAEAKLLWFLSELEPGNMRKQGENDVTLHVSQETVAQTIGTSRETVARLLGQLKRRGLLDWKRSTLLIPDITAVQKLAAKSGGRIRPTKTD